MKRYNYTLDLGLVFLISAILILILGMDITWWHAILVALLARCEFKLEWTKG